ncbi:uncharacterized protein LOC110706445 [Chenopodium quinoa]|uniref:uncharacterized protein LOC110706445 n=1 Tax=Chenopodium quinoa TaxID=63459 RepID=UPI000B78F230|nr:uncharacterized protein LOC110706445 [Chenopodium quinoa]
MLLTLSAKNKIGFVNGDYDKLADNLSAEGKAWERCNDLVCSWILFNVNECIASSVMFLRSAKAIWLDLEERFSYTSLAQIYAFEQKLTNISQRTQSVSKLFTSIKSVWDAIDEAHPLPYCTCNNYTCNLRKKIFERHQQKMEIQFMMKLFDKFATVRGNMLMMPALPEVIKAYRMFSQEKKHKEISHMSSNSESMAFFADKKRFSSFGGNTPGYFGGGAASMNKGYRIQSYKSLLYQYQQNTLSQPKSFGGTQKFVKPGLKFYCTHCEIPRNSIDRCLKLYGFPPSFKGFKEKGVALVSYNEQEYDVVENNNADDVSVE